MFDEAGSAVRPMLDAVEPVFDMMDISRVAVFLDTDGTYQFPTIKGFYCDGGGPIDVSIQGKSYYFMASGAKIPTKTFGFELIDNHGLHWFTPFAPVRSGNFEFGFSVNSNDITLNGITF